MVKTFNKDISTTVCDASSRKRKKKKEKRKYTKQRVMPITEGSDSLTQVSHTTYWRMREKVERERERERERQHSLQAQYTIIYSL